MDHLDTLDDNGPSILASLVDWHVQRPLFDLGHLILTAGRQKDLFFGRVALREPLVRCRLQVDPWAGR